MYERWTPSSRRDRRRGRARRKATKGLDRTSLVVAGVFLLGVILFLGVYLISIGVLYNSPAPLRNW